VRSDPVRELPARFYKVGLEVVLDVLRVDDAVGCEIASGEEECEERLGEESAVVGAPDHGGELFGLRLGCGGI